MQSFRTTEVIKEYSFVKLAEGELLEQANAKTDNIIGVSDSVNSMTGDVADVFVTGERAEIKAGGTFSAGDALTCDSEGHAVVAAHGDNIGAIALGSANAGDIVPVMVCIQRYFEEPTEEQE